MLNITYRNRLSDVVAMTVWASLHTWQFGSLWFLFILATTPATWNAAAAADVPFAFKVATVVIIELLLLVAAMTLNVALTAVFARISNDRGVFTTHEFSAGPEGLTEVTDVNSTTMTWSGVDRIVRMRRHLLIVIGPLKAHIIPRREVRDAQEWNRIFSTLKELHAASRT